MRLITPVLTLLIATVFASCSGKPTEVNCKKYRTGKYHFTAEYDGKKLHFAIDRNKETQTEVCEELNAVANYKIQWKDDCSYQLVFMDGKDNLPAEVKQIRRKMVVYTTILSGTDDYYLFETSSNLYDMVRKDTIWVTK